MRRTRRKGKKCLEVRGIETRSKGRFSILFDIAARANKRCSIDWGLGNPLRVEDTVLEATEESFYTYVQFDVEVKVPKYVVDELVERSVVPLSCDPSTGKPLHPPCYRVSATDGSSAGRTILGYDEVMLNIFLSVLNTDIDFDEDDAYTVDEKRVLVAQFWGWAGAASMFPPRLGALLLDPRSYERTFCTAAHFDHGRIFLAKYGRSEYVTRLTERYDKQTMCPYFEKSTNGEMYERILLGLFDLYMDMSKDMIPVFPASPSIVETRHHGLLQTAKNAVQSTRAIDAELYQQAAKEIAQFRAIRGDMDIISFHAYWDKEHFQARLLTAAIHSKK